MQGLARLIIALGCLLGPLVSAAGPPAEDLPTDLDSLPVWTIGRATRPPAIDGRLDDEVWETAAGIAQFHVLGRSEWAAKAQTQVLGAWDNENLYIAFICLDPDTAQLVGGDWKRDSPVWLHDSVDVLVGAGEETQGPQGPKGPHNLRCPLCPQSPPQPPELPPLPAYQWFCINTRNVQYDAIRPAGLDMDEIWNGTWESAVRIEPRRYTCEFRFNYQQLQLPLPRAGSVWRFNAGRDMARWKETSSWSPAKGHFNSPLGMGYLRFEDDPMRLRPAFPNPEFELGENPVTFQVSTPLSKRATASTPLSKGATFSTPLSKGGTLSTPLSKGGRGDWGELSFRAEWKDGEHWRTGHRLLASDIPSSTVTLPIMLRAAGEGRIAVSAYEPDGTLCFRGFWPYYLPPRAAWLRDARREERVAAQYQRARRRADGTGLAETLASPWSEPWSTAQTWRPGKVTQYPEGWEWLQARAERIHEELLTQGQSPRNACLVSVEDNWQKIFRDDPYLREPAQECSLSLAKNEYEGAQIIVTPLVREMKDVRVTVSDLTPITQPNGRVSDTPLSKWGKEGSVPPHSRVTQSPLDPLLPRGASAALLSATNITVNPVGYVHTATPDHAVEYTGWWPDPLLDKAAMDIPAGRQQPFWITVCAPPEQPAGTYTGTITVSAEGHEISQLRLTAQVRRFALPARSPLETSFTYWGRHWGGGDERQQTLDVCDFMLRHRLSTTRLAYYYLTAPNQFDSQVKESDAAVEHCRAEGLTGFALPGDIPHSGLESRQAEYLARIAHHLQEKGWLEDAYVYGWDEPSASDYPQVRALYAQLGQTLPGVRRLLTEEPQPQLFGAVDLWVPILDNYREEACRARQALGEEVWWYVCINPKHPFPGYFVDYPSLSPRVLPWMNWKYGVTGILYWGMDYWAQNLDKPLAQYWADDFASWDPNTFARSNGDGYLMYPGPHGEPLSSVRLENIRDGIEDYEYFWLLRQRLQGIQDPGLREQAQELLEIPESLIKDTSRYAQDPQLFATYRERIGDLLDRIMAPSEN